MKLLLSLAIVILSFLPVVKAINIQTVAPSEKTLRINLKDETNIKETVIRFRKGFSELYQISDGDAPSTGGTTIMIASLTSDNKNMAINFVPDLTEVSEIRLNVNSKTTKKATLSFSELPFAENYTLILKDNYLNTEMALSQGYSYEFHIDKSIKNTFGSERFSIAIKPIIDIVPANPPSTVSEIPPFTIYPNPATTDLYVKSGANHESIEASIFTLSGVLIKKEMITSELSGIDITNLPVQSYLIVLKESKSTKPVVVSKFIKQ